MRERRQHSSSGLPSVRSTTSSTGYSNTAAGDPGLPALAGAKA
jgi:hypothetical protein